MLSHSSVRLFWSAPLLRDRNGDITGYSIQVLTTDNTTYSTHEDVEERKLTVESLKEHTSYMFQVSAMTSVGRGPYKAHGPVTTAVGELQTSNYQYVACTCLLALMACAFQTNTVYTRYINIENVIL